MIYLVDNQLPLGLVEHLQAYGLDAVHVLHCGLECASDQEIWSYAKAHNCVTVSKDEDFFHLSGNEISGPPFVWVRLGNCRNVAHFAAFDDILSHLLETINAGAKVVEIR